MRRFLVFFLLGCAYAGVLWSGAPMESLEKLAQHFQSHPIWRADYSQEYIPAGMDEGEFVSGRLWLAWPDKLLFIQDRPEKRSMGFEGRKLRLVDEEAGSCDEHLMSQEEWERIPLMAILDTRLAVEHFSILESAPGEISLIPHEKGGVDRVEIFVGDAGMPRMLTLTDPQGALSRFKFSEWKEASSHPGESWLPAPPEGVECVGDPQ